MRHDSFQLSDLCIIHHASDGESSLQNGNFLGIFQIDSTQYCGLKSPGGKCGITCNSILINLEETNILVSISQNLRTAQYVTIFNVP